MLNRTNRTLSAHLNRLNLGTRSLASQASLNIGAKALHVRHADPVVMRAGVDGGFVDPGKSGIMGIPSIPGSPSVSPWLIVSPAIHPRVDSSAQVLFTTTARPAGLFTPPCPRPEEEPGRYPTRLPRERGRADREPRTGERWQAAGRAGLWLQATPGPLAAATAAAGG